MLDIANLRAFMRVADLGSISGAARSLRSPKPSISQAPSRLEEAPSPFDDARRGRQLDGRPQFCRVPPAGRIGQNW
jgi:Bacterial regulatory helix-turn-helix protein, lysR family